LSYIIEIEDLWFRYRGTKEYALKGVNMRIREGEFIVIMGPSGCGKTTLCYCLNGIIPHLIRGELRGKISVCNLNPAEHSVVEMSRYIGLVFQNPEMQLVTTSVYEEIAFALENLALPRKEIRRRVEEILTLTGLKGLENRSPFSLSGGEQQALAIASVLVLKPKVLILDEPTSQLDPWSTKLVADLIVKLRENLNMTIITIEHRMEWAAEHADRILIMDNGRIIVEGSPKDIFKTPEPVRTIGFRPPQVSEIAYRLQERGFKIPTVPITLPEAIELYEKILREGRRYGNSNN